MAALDLQAAWSNSILSAFSYRFLVDVYFIAILQIKSYIVMPQ
jgi:hypothetical protein